MSQAPIRNNRIGDVSLSVGFAVQLECEHRKRTIKMGIEFSNPVASDRTLSFPVSYTILSTASGTFYPSSSFPSSTVATFPLSPLPGIPASRTTLSISSVAFILSPPSFLPSCFSSTPLPYSAHDFPHRPASLSFSTPSNHSSTKSTTHLTQTAITH